MGVRLVLASANPHKAAEMAALLATSGFDLVPRPPGVPEVEETGATLEDNARLKAEALVAATGEAAVADDTGLEVAALGGAPGVRSARYAGPGASYADNVARLLQAMDGVALDQRQARFRTVALALFPDGREVAAEGVVDGQIAMSPRGEGGFGYDAVFVPAGGDGRTFAEMTAAEKNAVSHRGRAFRALAAGLHIPAAGTPAVPE
ncbi:MAG: non-canonical purine NTP pyrophosphatase, RdgB/HAM1 family [Actinobacteria bacterium]|nr:MAG: non-canonical purine NTP pyrophosphatase, RdgB/HAM1 family [Actinomycetota bacterium]